MNNTQIEECQCNEDFVCLACQERDAYEDDLIEEDVLLAEWEANELAYGL